MVLNTKIAMTNTGTCYYFYHHTIILVQKLSTFDIEVRDIQIFQFDINIMGIK